MKKILIVSFLIFSSSSAIADDRWEKVASNQESIVYIDTSSIHGHDNDRSVWVKFLTRKSKIKEIGLAESKVLFAYNCLENTVKTEQQTDYNSNGKPINSWFSSYFEKAVPETFGEHIGRRVCGWRWYQ